MLYKIHSTDIPRAAGVLADAFQHDPLWNRIFAGVAHKEKRFRAFFTVPLKYCLRYGEVYATSADIEGVIAWVSGRYADMTPWRIFCSGAIIAAMQMGMSAARKLEPVSLPLAEDRRQYMAGRDYLYLLLIGVATTLQGKGFGRKLLKTAIAKTDREGQPLYLETETAENMQMYERFGFRLLKQITLPVVDLPMWEMVRTPCNR